MLISSVYALPVTVDVNLFVVPSTAIVPPNDTVPDVASAFSVIEECTRALFGIDPVVILPPDIAGELVQLGAPLVLPTSTSPVAPAAVAKSPFVVFPYTTPSNVNDVDPVPPLPTGNGPDIAAAIFYGSAPHVAVLPAPRDNNT